MHKKLTLTAMILVLVLLCGTAAAYMITRTSREENQFTPADVACAVAETFDGTYKSSITIKNTGNIDAYIRVRLVTYWVSKDGNILSKPSKPLEISLAPNWFQKGMNTYYYVSPVSPSDSPVELLGNAITLAEEDGSYQVVEVFAEAIQALGTTDVGDTPAVTNAWGIGVNPTTKELIIETP